jgi:hypothetical protein
MPIHGGRPKDKMQGYTFLPERKSSFWIKDHEHKHGSMNSGAILFLTAANKYGRAVDAEVP